MATHSSILAWRIPWTEGPGRLQPMGLHRVGHDWATNTTCHEICNQSCLWSLASYDISHLVLERIYPWFVNKVRWLHWLDLCWLQTFLLHLSRSTLMSFWKCCGILSCKTHLRGHSRLEYSLLCQQVQGESVPNKAPDVFERPSFTHTHTHIHTRDWLHVNNLFVVYDWVLQVGTRRTNN